MNLVLEIEEPSPKPEEEPCKGLYFRGKVNEYFSGLEWRRDERLTFLKRKSCSGCEQCDWITDFIPDVAYEDLDHGNMYAEVPKIEHGALYTLKTAWHSTDWETGKVDDIGLAYEKVQE